MDHKERERERTGREGKVRETERAVEVETFD